jgi:hypothetical protein
VVVVVGHSGGAELWLCGGRWASVLVSLGLPASVLVSLGLLAWERVKVTNIGNGVLFGLSATLVDDRFVQPDPALDGVGILVEKGVDRFREKVAV